MRRSIAVVVLFLALAAVGRAQVAEVAITGGWSAFTDSNIGFLGFDAATGDQVDLDNGIRIGGRLSMNRWFLGHEISYAWQKSNLRIEGPAGSESSGMSIQNFYYNFVAHATPQGTAIRPFVTAGVGVSTFFPPGASSLSGGGDNKFGYNYGGGLKFRLSEKFGLRFDARDHVTGRPFKDFLQPVGGKFHNIEYSAGFALLF
jgi:opacity protein-like surface antigen